jgi:RimJ/RimL family protein N-acetyltransferase
MRAVTADDADVLLAWRNHPATRAASLNTAEIDRATHVDWLARTIADPTRVLYIGQQGEVPIGTVRFDLDEDPDTAEVSITVSPSHRGRGLSLPLLRAGLTEFAAEPRRRSVIRALIREENGASRSLFDAAGFREESRADGVLHLRRELDAAAEFSGRRPS